MKITDEQFDGKLAEIIDFDNVKASQLLSVPGVYEIMAEYYNNEVIAALESEAELEQATWITIYEKDGERYISDSGNVEILADCESDLTEDQVFYDEDKGYIHADGSPIMIKG